MRVIEKTLNELNEVFSEIKFIFFLILKLVQNLRYHHGIFWGRNAVYQNLLPLHFLPHLFATLQPLPKSLSTSSRGFVLSSRLSVSSSPLFVSFLLFRLYTHLYTSMYTHVCLKGRFHIKQKMRCFLPSCWVLNIVDPSTSGNFHFL